MISVEEQLKTIMQSCSTKNCKNFEHNTLFRQKAQEVSAHYCMKNQVNEFLFERLY